MGVGFSGFPRPMRGAGPVDPRDLTGDRAPRRAERPDALRAPCRRMSQDCQRESSMVAKAEKDVSEVQVLTRSPQIGRAHV